MDNLIKFTSSIFFFLEHQFASFAELLGSNYISDRA